jgi:hypothetical protein
MKLKYIIGNVDAGIDLHLLEESIDNFKVNNKTIYESKGYMCRFVQSTNCYETLKGFETEIVLEICCVGE